jgi:hypothetical protein
MSFSSTPLGQGRRLDQHTFLNKNHRTSPERDILASHTYRCVNYIAIMLFNAKSSLGYLSLIAIIQPQATRTNRRSLATPDSNNANSRLVQSRPEQSLLRHIQRSGVSKIPQSISQPHSIKQLPALLTCNPTIQTIHGPLGLVLPQMCHEALLWSTNPNPSQQAAGV